MCLALATNVIVVAYSYIINVFRNITGSLCAGFLYDRFTKILVIVGIMLLLTVTTALVPFCTSFASMLIIHVLGGISYGADDVG